jgi:transglutaminase-like putative cysteine protease
MWIVPESEPVRLRPRMWILVTHRTAFEYDETIAETVMELRLRPRSTGGQRCHGFELAVTPAGAVSERLDLDGNTVHFFNYRPPHRHVDVVSRSLVETGLPAPAEPPAPLRPIERARFLQFDGPVERLPAVDAWAARLRPADPADGAVLAAALLALTEEVHTTLAYRPGVTGVYTTVGDVLAAGAGVCQDFTHVWLAVARAMGVPARYVSGYILSGGDRQGAEASHAWAEAWVPGRGWCGYDPTNPLQAGAAHVAVAVGRHYGDVPPTKGFYRGTSRERLHVEVSTAVASPNALATFSTAAAAS